MYFRCALSFEKFAPRVGLEITLYGRTHGCGSLYAMRAMDPPLYYVVVRYKRVYMYT